MKKGCDHVECLFCKIANHELQATVVVEDEHIIAFEDINKIAPVHVLVVPKKHLQNVAELDPEDMRLLSAIQAAIKHIVQATGIEESGFRVVTNAGESAGQSVFHLHYHVIGGRNLNVALG